MSVKERDRLKVLHEVHKTAYRAAAGGSGVGGKRTLGMKSARALASARRRRPAAWAAGETLEPEDATC